MKFLASFVILISLLTQSLTFNYGPSIEFLTRGRGDAAHSTKVRGKTLFLQEFPNKSVVIPLLDGKTSADPKVASKFFHNFHYARFFVEAPRGYRIMAIIQSLDLATSTGTVSRCLDHIMFHDIDSRNQSSHICGTVFKDDLGYDPENLIGPRYFSSRGNSMAVDVFILSGSLQPTKSANLKGHLTIEIGFTAFPADADCSNGSTALQNSYSKLELQACTPPDMDSDRFAVTECIPGSLFCDGVINCAASSDMEFAYDEQNCTELRQLEASFYDIDESNIMAEIRYRRKLAEMEDNSDTWIIHYVVIGLAGVVISILVFSCLCYWGIWLFPNSSSEEPEEKYGKRESIQTVTIENHDLDSSPTIDAKMGFAEKRFRSKSLAPLNIPATLKVNPDGSHSIEAYHGNRRLTISVN